MIQKEGSDEDHKNSKDDVPKLLIDNDNHQKSNIEDSEVENVEQLCKTERI